MYIEVEFELYNTTYDSLVSEGRKFLTLKVDKRINLDGRKGLDLLYQEVRKEINRSIYDVKILGYKVI